MYLNENKTDELDQQVERANIPIEVLSEDDKPITKDTFVFKQKNFLAVVAAIPIIAGIFVSVLLTMQQQDVRRKAAELNSYLEINCLPVPKLIIRMPVHGELKGVEIKAYESINKKAIYLTYDSQTGSYLGEINLAQINPDSGTIQIQIIRLGVVLKQMELTYGPVVCNK